MAWQYRSLLIDAPATRACTPEKHHRSCREHVGARRQANIGYFGEREASRRRGRAPIYCAVYLQKSTGQNHIAALRQNKGLCRTVGISSHRHRSCRRTGDIAKHREACKDESPKHTIRSEIPSSFLGAKVLSAKHNSAHCSRILRA